MRDTENFNSYGNMMRETSLEGELEVSGDREKIESAIKELEKVLGEISWDARDDSGSYERFYQLSVRIEYSNNLSREGVREYNEARSR